MRRSSLHLLDVIMRPRGKKRPASRDKGKNRRLAGEDAGGEEGWLLTERSEESKKSGGTESEAVEE